MDNRPRKKGDLFDLAMLSATKANEDPYQKYVTVYPEDVQKVLALFLKFWKLPEFSIPTQKRNSAGFSRWIKELRELVSLTNGHDLERTFESYHYHYSKQPYIVSAPGSITKGIVMQVSLQNQKLESFTRVEKEEHIATELKVDFGEFLDD